MGKFIVFLQLTSGNYPIHSSKMKFIILLHQKILFRDISSQNKVKDGRGTCQQMP